MKVIRTDEQMDFADMLVTRWFVLRHRDVLVIVVSAATLAIATVELVKAPPYFGFGPDWECSYPGDGEAVCVKKHAPSAPTQPFHTGGGG
jgi:hypothetical protein